MLSYKKQKKYSSITCDCGGKVIEGEFVSTEQNSDRWFICESCGSTELLGKLLGMYCKHMQIRIVKGCRICKNCGKNLGIQPEVKKQDVN